MICDVHGVKGCKSKGCRIWTTLLGLPMVETDDLPNIKDGDLVLGTWDDILTERSREMIKCGKCRFWEKRMESETTLVGEKRARMGTCHRGRPQVVLLPGPSPIKLPGVGDLCVQVHGFFPPTNEETWCGEGEPA
jgi:hypothetical protein